jgi:phage gpG-like protein
VQQRSLLKGLGVEGEEQTKDRFDTKRDPEGRRWRDISATYRTFLSRHYSGAQPPLVREGYMRDSIESQVQGSDRVLIGSTREYADYHQSAKRETRRRKFLGLSADNLDDLQDIITVFMEKHL